MAIFVVIILYSIFEWIGVFMWSWEENGVGFTIKFIIFMLLLISPALVKDYAPDYYGLSIWAIILYSIGLLAHKIWTKGLDKYDDKGNSL